VKVVFVYRLFVRMAASAGVQVVHEQRRCRRSPRIESRLYPTEHLESLQGSIRGCGLFRAVVKDFGARAAAPANTCVCSRHRRWHEGCADRQLYGGVMPTWSEFTAYGPTIAQHLFVLALAAVLGAALGLIRPARRETVPRPAHILQAQILLAVVGAIIIVVVAESLARAFAIVGAAGLVRYRARVKDPKDAGVMLVALAIGLTVGSGLYGFAVVACAFVVGLMWVLESFEPAARSRFELTIGGKDTGGLRPDIEHALRQKGVTYELLGSSAHELHYEVTVPVSEKIGKLTKLIRGLDARHGTSVEWDIKKQKLLKS
jgi:uncharacterized membrane protein YhiD involved in acid resistance